MDCLMEKQGSRLAQRFRIDGSSNGIYGEDESVFVTGDQ